MSGFFEQMATFRRWVQRQFEVKRERRVFSNAERRAIGRGGERYTADNLPGIRARKGVGRPPMPADAEWSSWARGAQADHVNAMVTRGGILVRRDPHRWMTWAPPANDAWWDAIGSTTVLRKSKRRKGRTWA